MLAATAGGSAPAPIVIAAEAPPWIGPLDVLIVAGEDPGDPALVGAAASGVRRGARVVIAAPYEGALRDSHRRSGGGAGAAAAGRRRLRSVPLPGRRAGRPGKRRPPAAGGSGRNGRRAGRGGVAQQRRPGSLHQPGQGVGRAHVEASRGVRRRLRRDPGAGPARHPACCCASRTRWSPPPAWPMRWPRSGAGPARASSIRQRSLFHDEEIDGPITDRLRVVVLALDAERAMVAVAGCRVRRRRRGRCRRCARRGRAAWPRARTRPGAQRAEQQLAILAVRLEMAAVYLRLVRG